MKSQRQSILPYESKQLYAEKKNMASSNPFKAYVRARRIKTLKPVLAVMILVTIWYVLVGRDILPPFIEQLSIGKNNEVGPVFYEASCSEANLARMIVLCCKGESDQSGEKELPKAAENAQWYESYYAELGQLGVTCLKTENAFKVVSFECLKESFTECFGEQVTNIVITEKEDYQLYEVIGYFNEALEKTGKCKMDFIDVAILGSPSDEIPLEAWQLLTDKGKMGFEGLILAPLKNQTVKLAVVDDEVLGVMEIVDKKCEISHCKITEVTKQQVSYEVFGITFTYENNLLSKEQEGQFLDLTLADDKIIDFKMSGFEVVDTLLKVTDQYLTFEEAGNIPYRSVAVSDATDLNRFHSLDELVYGVKVAYTMEGEYVTTLKVIGQSSTQVIRVVLTDAKGKYEQEEVSIIAEEDYDLLFKGKAQTLEKGATWDSQKFNWGNSNSTVKLIPRSDSKLTLISVEKGGTHPQYKGVLEITKTEKGYVIVNAVDLEEYVAGVLFSEMPSSYEIEALKAQAVAARTYGANSMTSNRFLKYGANVDDTTSCQVYNRIGAADKAYEVTAATAGLVLVSDGKLTGDKFFATSCGFTANSGDVWGNDHFPGNTPDYLQAEKQFEDALDMKNLSKEEDFESFIQMGEEELTAYDEASPWFRWQVNLTKKQLKNLVLPALQKLEEQESTYLSYEMSSKGKKQNTTHDIGEITGFEVRQRGEGGNIMVLAINGTKGTAVVKTEYVIRSLFASNKKESLEVNRNDGSTASKQTLLPSAFFMIDPKVKDNELISVSLIGGGYGHGVGLSQDGANGLAKEGKDYREILSHYFKGTQVVNFWDQVHK